MLRWRGHRGRDPRTKAECITELRDRLYDPDLIQRALASCDDVTRDALALLKRKGGVMPAAAMRGQIATWHPGLQSSEIQRVPSELIRRALGFWHSPFARYAGSSVHDVLRPAGDNPRAALVFSEPEILDHVSVPPLLGQVPLLPKGEADWSESPVLSVRQILSFLRAVESRAPRVLRTGLIGTRDRSALARIAGLESVDSLRPAPPGELTPDGAGSAINFLHRVLVGAGVIRVTDDGHLQSTEVASEFVRSSPVRQAHRLLQAWLRTGDSVLLELTHLRCDRRANAPTVIPTLPETRLAYKRVVDLLRRSTRPGYWYTFADLSNVVRYDDVEFLISWRDPSPYDWRPYDVDRDGYVPTSYVGISLEDSRGRPRSLTMGADWELVEGAFLRAVLQGPLTWLGLIRSGVASDGQEAFALTRLGALVLDLAGPADDIDHEATGTQRDALLVQPNFEIIIYDPDERPQLLFHVDRFADRVSVDRLAVYHLSRESLCRGLQLGMAVNDVVALLENSARASVPQNVVFSIRDWARQFEQVRLTRHCWLLEAPDPSALDCWLEDPGVAEAVDHRLSPTLALVRDTIGLRGQLAKLGADVRPVDAESPMAAHAKVLDSTTLRISRANANLFLGTAVEAFADVSSDGDGTVEVRLSEESIRGATRGGLTWGRIVDLLSQMTDRPLPPGMLTRVKGWSGAYDAIGIAAVAYVEAPDPDTFAELWADRELADGLVTMVSPTAAIMRSDAVDRFRAALANRGIPVTRTLTER
jgi:hypothetical protein